MEECIFCRILKGELPSYKIYEDNFVYSFLDISNDGNGHILVIPKKHYVNIMDCDEKYLSKISSSIQKIGNHLVNNCGFSGINVMNCSGSDAGQSIFHLHFHIWPRSKGDGLKIFPELQKCNISLDELCERLKLEEKFKKVTLYTDGACSVNPGIGGYGAILIYNENEKIVSGGEENTTNNRMELQAIISGLEAIKESCKVDIYSDSAYVVNAFQQGWIEKWAINGWRTSSGEVQNRDLWQRLLELLEKHKVEWHKVKGHANNEYNNRCDALARGEIDKIKKLINVD